MLEWSLRGEHELCTSQGRATFITLTYKPRYLPKTPYNEDYPIEKQREEDAMGNLRPKDMTLFWKRLRKFLEKTLPGRKIKYIYCGEYGTKRFRPHYHAVIFNLEATEIDEKVLQKIWGMGKVDKDKNNVTGKGIAYTVGYASKKILDREQKREQYYKKGRLPPFLRTSKGIGKQWALSTVDLWKDTLTIPREKLNISVPRYYLKLFYKQEGIMLKGKQLQMNTWAPYKQKERSVYRLLHNPYGEYTHTFYQARVNKKLQEIKDCEEDYSNKFYFETLKLREKELKYIFTDENKRIQDWNILQQWGKDFLQERLFKKHAVTIRNYCEEDWRYSNAEINSWVEISDEYKEEERAECNERIEAIFKGIYGKRQRMEEQQEYLNEGI